MWRERGRGRIGRQRAGEKEGSGLSTTQSKAKEIKQKIRENI